MSLTIGINLDAKAKADSCHWISSNPVVTSFDLKLTDEVEQLPIRRLNNDITINKIIINRYNVFDENNPKEQNTLFEWLNAIHIVTKEQVIRDMILFKEGDLYQVVQQPESERLLRGSKYIYDARIRPLRLCDNKVDIEVTTRDLWSLTPSISFTRTGGESKQRVSISDSNFLGTGKSITLARSQEDQRTDYLIKYKDPNIWGTRRTTTIEISDNSDGYRQFINFKLPFYALASTRSYGFDFNNEKRVDSIYHQTILSSEFEHKLRQASVFYGLSGGYMDKQSLRWRFGLSFQQDKFKSTALKNALDPLPLDRKLFYPWIGVELLEDRFIKLENYHSMKRTEDINLGRYVAASIGYSDKALGDDITRLIIDLEYKNALKFEQHLFDFDGSLNGYWQTDQAKFDDLLAKFNANYYNFHANDWVFYSSLSLNYSKNLSLDRQLFLGGDTGLRGFPLRYIEARKTVKMSLEERYYSDLYWFSLVRVGAAIYFDIGKAWGNIVRPPVRREENDQWLANAGIGLRLTPTRADANHVIHLDLAFPLNGDDDIDKVQFIVKVRQSF